MNACQIAEVDEQPLHVQTRDTSYRLSPPFLSALRSLSIKAISRVIDQHEGGKGCKQNVS